jgi:hypothetical protein
MNMMENQTRQYSNEELRARFNPEGSLLWKHQQRMVELLSLPRVKAFSAFDTVADLYFVRIPPTIYEVGRHSLWDSLKYCTIYTYRKYQRKWFGYSYKQHCQQKFQQLKQSL